MNDILIFILVIVSGYLAGSIPSGIIAGKVLKGIEIREHGSGNIGMTNVFRVLGWKAGIFVGIVDLLKGYIPVALIAPAAAGRFLINLEILQVGIGVTAVFGHIFTIFGGFKGGKGVLTTAGVFLGLMPVTALIAVTAFLLAAIPTRYISFGSIVAAVTLIFTVSVRKFILGQTVGEPTFILTLIVGVLILITHRGNIRRLLHGTERKFSFK